MWATGVWGGLCPPRPLLLPVLVWGCWAVRSLLGCALAEYHLHMASSQQMNAVRLTVGCAVAASAVAAYLAIARRARPKLPKLTWLPLDLSIVRLGAAATNWPTAPVGTAFYSATRTADETSIVLESRFAPVKDEAAGVEVEGDWVMFRLEGPLDFALVGILAKIATALARHSISIFAISTYDTDYVMLKRENQQAATTVLRASGYTVETA
jgi:hypothetical protein